MPVPFVGRKLAEAGNSPLPAVDLGQRGVGFISNGELPVFGCRARHLAEASSEGFGPGLLIRSTDTGLPLVRRHLPRVRMGAAVGKKSRIGNVATLVAVANVESRMPKLVVS